jgi:regulatory protein SWI6
MTSSLTEVHSQFAAELRVMQDRIDSTTSHIREISAQQKELSTHAEANQSRARDRQERKRRIQNLRRAVAEMRERVPLSKKANGAAGSVSPQHMEIGEADVEFAVPDSPQLPLPDSGTLTSRLSTYKSLNASLSAHLTSLKARDTELEAKYRKVVALCTNVSEEKIDTVLGQLVMAVESEPENDLGRVREFLRRVEAIST